MNQVENIKQMEQILDEHSKCIEDLQKALGKFDKSQKEFDKLKEYYGSEQFMQDYEDSNEDKLPDDLKCGVLSEDAVFDLIGDNFHTAVEMLEIATEIIKNH